MYFLFLKDSDHFGGRYLTDILLVGHWAFAARTSNFVKEMNNNTCV